ncbi:MAG: hypothetical protein R2795_07465 [Saprospiraceae bacterium]
MIEKMAFLSNLELAEGDLTNTVSFLVGNDAFYLAIDQEVDVEAEVEKLAAELAHAQRFVEGINRKLSNEKFVQNAHPDVVAKERQKYEDGQARIKSLEETLARLKG